MAPQNDRQLNIGVSGLEGLSSGSVYSRFLFDFVSLTVLQVVMLA